MKYGLGTFSNNVTDPYPGIVINERVVKLKDLARSDSSFTSVDSVLGLLEDWESTFASINQLLSTNNLDDFESHSLQDLKVHPPL